MSEHNIAFVKFPDEKGDVYIRAELIIGIAPWRDKFCNVTIKGEEYPWSLSAESVTAMELVVLSHGEAGSAAGIVMQDPTVEKRVHEIMKDALREG